MKRETVKMMASWALALALSLSTARSAQALLRWLFPG